MRLSGRNKVLWLDCDPRDRFVFSRRFNMRQLIFILKMYKTLPSPMKLCTVFSLVRYLNRISRFTVSLYNAYMCMYMYVQTEFRWNNRKAKGYIDFSFHESFLYNHSAWIARLSNSTLSNFIWIFCKFCESTSFHIAGILWAFVYVYFMECIFRLVWIENYSVINIFYNKAFCNHYS